MEACEAACSREAAAAALVMALTDRVRKGQLELDDLREESAEDKDEIRRLKDQVRACAASFRSRPANVRVRPRRVPPHTRWPCCLGVT